MIADAMVMLDVMLTPTCRANTGQILRCAIDAVRVLNEDEAGLVARLAAARVENERLKKTLWQDAPPPAFSPNELTDA